MLVEILTFSFMKMRLKVSSAKWHPFCLGLNELTHSGLGPDILQPSLAVTRILTHCGLVAPYSDMKLAQVMAYYLMAPSYYLNQYQFIINRVLCHSPEGNSSGNYHESNHYNAFENYTSKIKHLTSPGNTEWTSVSAAFIWKLSYDWLEALWQRQIVVVTQVPGDIDYRNVIRSILIQLITCWLFCHYIVEPFRYKHRRN